jgi:hypothetical protein
MVALRSGQRSDAVGDAFARDQGEVQRAEKYAELVRSHFAGDRSTLITVSTTVLALLGEEGAHRWSEGRSEFSAFRDACVSAGLTPFRLPRNELAVQDIRAQGASIVTFQPGILKRVDRYTVELRAKVAKVGGLELGYFGDGRAGIHEALKTRIESESAGPCMRLTGAYTGLVKPDDSSLEDWSLTMTFVAPSDDAVELLDRLTSDVEAHPLFGHEGAAVRELSGDAAGDTPVERVRRWLRRSPLTWAVRPGKLDLMSHRTNFSDLGVGEDSADRIWNAHVEEHVRALAIDIGFTDDAPKHRLRIGLLAVPGADASGRLWTFDVSAAYDLWLNDQNRRSIEAEAAYEDKDLDSSPFPSLAAMVRQPREERRAQRLDAFARRLTGVFHSIVK